MPASPFAAPSRPFVPSAQVLPQAGGGDANCGQAGPLPHRVPIRPSSGGEFLGGNSSSPYEGDGPSVVKGDSVFVKDLNKTAKVTAVTGSRVYFVDQDGNKTFRARQNVIRLQEKEAEMAS